MELTDEFIDSIARSRGWVDYPNDSVEHGSIWHCDKDKAPFGNE